MSHSVFGAAFLLTLSSFVVIGCGVRTAGGVSRSDAQSSDRDAKIGREDSQAASEVDPNPSTETDAGHHPLLDDRQPDKAGSLPEVSFRHLGLHIGGESNSAEAKKPWLDAISAEEERLLRCYRYVTSPLSGGSFGVDLYVSSRGGAAEVRASRQKIGGQEFDDCMVKAFSQIAFPSPIRPTVLSYSLLFEVKNTVEKQG